MTENERWFVRSHGKAIGPFPREKLQRWWTRGDIDDSTLVRREGDEVWVKASESSLAEPVTLSAPSNSSRTRPAPPPPPPELESFSLGAPAGQDSPSRSKRSKKPTSPQPPPTTPSDSPYDRVDRSTYGASASRNYSNPTLPKANRGLWITIVALGLLVVFLLGIQAGWILRETRLSSDRDVARNDSDSADKALPPTSPPLDPESHETNDSASNPNDSAERPINATRSSQQPDGESDESVSTDRVDDESTEVMPEGTVESEPPMTAASEEGREGISTPSSALPEESELGTEPDESMPLPESEPEEPAREVAPIERTKLYQSADIVRISTFDLLGAPIQQELHYQLRSELLVTPENEDGIRSVSQTILDTVLINSDELSRASIQSGLERLKGWQFEFKVNRIGEVIEWTAGPLADSDVRDVRIGGEAGTVVSTVLDEDGWKELSQLTMFSPIERIQGQQPLERQMTHDFGPLGSWYGITGYRRVRHDAAQWDFQFAHRLTYEPPSGDEPNTLPFKIVSATFTPQKAEGELIYDPRLERVTSLTEWFEVQGNLQVELLGSTAPLDFRENQRLHVMVDEKPLWEVREE